MSVYKLTDGEKVYYGSTSLPLQERLWGHKSINNECEAKHLNKDNMTIELLEEVEDKEQRLWRERHYMENNECVNINLPIATSEEKKAHNRNNYYKYRGLYLEERRKYRDKNREKISEDKKKPYHCECGSVVTTGHMARHMRSKKHINFINE